MEGWKLTRINQAWLTTNYNCNYNCTWCYAKKASRKKIMNLEIFKTYVDELKKNRSEKHSSHWW